MERSCYMTQQRRKQIQYSSESRVQHSRVTVHFHPPTSLFKCRVQKTNSFTFRCQESITRENFGDNKIYKKAADSETFDGKQFYCALVKENFAAESETFGGKRISLLDHQMSHDPEASNENMRCKGGNNSYKGIYLLSGLSEWWMTNPARHLQLLPQRRLSQPRDLFFACPAS